MIASSLLVDSGEVPLSASSSGCPHATALLPFLQAFALRIHCNILFTYKTPKLYTTLSALQLTRRTTGVSTVGLFAASAISCCHHAWLNDVLSNLLLTLVLPDLEDT